jgi:sodium transport system permease protein
LNIVLHIVKKELRDMFRDKRVRSMSLFTPVLMMVMFVFMFGYLEDTVGKPSNLKIHIVKGSPEVEASLRKSQMGVIEVNSVEEGKALIKKGEAKLVLEFPDKLPTPGNFHPVKINAYFDPKQEMSRLALGAVQSAFSTQNQQILKEVFKARGMPENATEPIQVVGQEVTIGGKNGAGQIVIQILPYLIVIWAFYGGMSIATELVAGEKEKNTLETLLISPATRTQIAMGKFLSLSAVCLLSSVSSFIGLFVMEKLSLPMTRGLFPHGLGVGFDSAGIILLVLVPTVALFASLLLAISAYAKNPREAQTYLTGVSFLVLMPAMASQFIGYTDFASSRWLFSIPVLNTATVIRQVLQAKPDTIGVIVTIGVSMVLALIALKAAVVMFNREQVLVRV